MYCPDPLPPKFLSILEGYRNLIEPVRIAEMLGISQKDVTNIASAMRRSGYDIPYAPRLKSAFLSRQATKTTKVSGYWRGHPTSIYSQKKADALSEARRLGLTGVDDDEEA